MSTSMAAPDPEVLSRVVARELGEVSIGGIQRVSGGASRETWLFDAVDTHGTTHGLVLRRDPGSRAGSSTDRATEFHLLDAAYRAGVPAPRVRLLLEPDDGLGHGFVMDRVAGETIARKLLRDDEFAGARRVATSQCGTIAAAIHRVPVETLPTLAFQGAAAQLDQWRALLDSLGEPHSAFELALDWMADRMPAEPVTPSLVHGDFRNGNFIVDADGIRAVLDWELAHLGDPIEDLGWLCVRAWRFGSTLPVGGFGPVSELLDAYERAGGRRPSDDELRFWIAAGTLKWGMICLVQAFTHLNGIVRSVELAAIGRRVAENEYDILRVIDGKW